jgi:formylmethanofuran dehydrogenase subunit E
MIYDEDEFECHTCGEMTNYRKLVCFGGDQVCPDCLDILDN